jgi:hypothetical protein
MIHGLISFFLAGGVRPVNLTQADLQRLADSAADGPIFYAVMAALFPVLLGPVLQECYVGFAQTGTAEPAQQRDQRKRGTALALAVLMGLLGVILSLIWRNDPLQLNWRAFIVCSAFLFLLLVVAARVLVAIRHAAAPGAVASTPPISVHTKGMPPRLRVLMSHGAGLLCGIVVGSGCFFLLGPTSASNARVRAVYRVYGTCAAGAGRTCGLNARLHPTSHSEPRGQLRDGDSVTVVCQTVGEKQTNPNGVSTDVWDKLATGAYITDLYLDTPQIGTDIRACPTGVQTPASTR